MPPVVIHDRIERLPISDLVPYARNSRTHSDEQLAQIAASMREFGFTNPVLIDEQGGIVAGHGRVMAAQRLGMAHVPCLRLAGLTEAQRRAYVIADNQIALNAGWDDAMLRLELADLQAADFNLDLLGFDADRLDELLADEVDETKGLTDADEVPEVPEQPATRPGDVWLLGRHRVMCGDSTSIDAVDSLTQGEAPDMVFTDPPYGISHSGNGITAPTKSGRIVEGNAFGEILGDGDVSVASDAYRLCASQWPDARMIFWGANYYASVLPDGHGWLVWDKQRVGDTFSGAEIAFVNGGIRVDVFRHMWHGIAKASESGEKRLHPTQKPSALAEWCFERYGDPKTVLDLFGGSGSTLIACEKTGRTARLMELDPKYCDVIVKRWQDFTGQQATLEATGQTFDEVSAGA